MRLFAETCLHRQLVKIESRYTMVTFSVLLPSGGQRILFMLAHPDDGEFLWGSTVALLTEEGQDIHWEGIYYERRATV